MDFRKHALLLAVIEQFHRSNEFPKSIHVQKAVSMLDSTGLFAMPFAYILYKHGPYSLDVEFELDQMQSYLAIYADPTPTFAQVLRIGRNGALVKHKVPLSAPDLAAITSVCRFLSRRPLPEIELLATAAWVWNREQLRIPIQIAGRLRALKPYISDEDALRRSREISDLANRGQPRLERVG